MPQDPGRNQFEPVFNQLYECHYTSLYAYFFGRTGDTEMALDLLQETFTRAWRHIATLAEMEKSQHRYWLFSVAKNLFTDSLRRAARWQKVEAELLAAAQVAAQPPPDPIAIQQQLLLLEGAIAQLPEQLRVVLALSVLGGMNSTQIGEALDMAAGTVRYQLAVARKQLMEHIEQG
ncbi:MAG: RNA polymerase sigma factor [Caldilineaceae bacterium]